MTSLHQQLLHTVVVEVVVVVVVVVVVAVECSNCSVTSLGLTPGSVLQSRTPRETVTRSRVRSDSDRRYYYSVELLLLLQLVVVTLLLLLRSVVILRAGVRRDRVTWRCDVDEDR